MYTKEIPQDAHVFTVKDWKRDVSSRCLIDYDGWGYPAKDGKMSTTSISPSSADKCPKDATHIVWFNR